MWIKPDHKQKEPNCRNEYWLSLHESVDGSKIWIDDMTYCSDGWYFWQRENHMNLVDHVIKGNTAVMYIQDYGEFGYDQCKAIGIAWYTGKCYVYRLD